MPQSESYGRPRTLAQRELEPRRGASGEGRRLLLRPDVPVVSEPARAVPGADGPAALPPAARDRDRGPDPGRSGEVRRLPARTGPGSPQVPRGTGPLRGGGGRVDRG